MKKSLTFAQENLENLKRTFFQSEMEILECIQIDETEDMSEEIEYLKNQFDSIKSSEDLIKVINDRSEDLDLSDEGNDEYFFDYLKKLLN